MEWAYRNSLLKALLIGTANYSYIRHAQKYIFAKYTLGISLHAQIYFWTCPIVGSAN
jgi:hypothetical protein